MATESCACGFVPDDSLELADHLNEMFTPDDDMGADGQAHQEQAGGRTCSCGYTATTTDDLDAHFRVAFPPPADRIGDDGQKHAPVQCG